MMAYNSTEFIEAEVPILVRALFPQALSAAYQAVEDLVNENPILQVPSFQKGDLIAAATDFALYNLVNSKRWPDVTASWEWFSRPTGRYLEIRTKNARTSVSQLTFIDQPPRHAIFRKNARFYNQRFLFEEMTPPSTDIPHLVIGHGYQDLAFIVVGMPHPDKPDVWLDRSKNVFDELYVIENGLAPVEAADAEAVLSLKELIKKQAKEYGA